MQIVFLGSGGYFATERRQTACVMLPESGIVFDAGSGMYRLSQFLQTEQLDIFLSHGHLDHICGLTTLLVSQHISDLEQVNVHAQSHVLEAIQTHLFSGTVFPVIPRCEWLPLQSTTSLPNHFKIETISLTTHPGGSIGFRCTQEEISLAYITDTTVDGTYENFIQGIDLLIHECYFHDDDAGWAEKTGHSYTTAVAELAARTGVKRLVLVHIDPTQTEKESLILDHARQIFPRTELATDMFELQL